LLKNQLTVNELLRMKNTEKVLKEELSKIFEGQSQRLTMLSKLIIALFKLSTVSYSKLCLAINPDVKKSSNFKRIQRFMKDFHFSQKCYINFVWKLFVNSEKWIALSIDRTNWKFGKQNINILLIGISYRGTAIPLIWKMLDKRGNSSQEERIDLMNELLNILDKEQKNKIRCLLADREFIGTQWITYLKGLPFTFFIRIKNNTLVRKLGKSKQVHAKNLFDCSHFRALRKKRVLFGHRLFIGGQKIGDNEWLIIISDIPVKRAKNYYGERWGIEVFFGACKKRGFNFEDTHVTKLDRISNLVFLIAIAFCWALKTGEYLLDNGHQIPIKKLKTRKAKLYSIFRIGLDRLKELLLNFLNLKSEISLLSCT